MLDISKQAVHKSRKRQELFDMELNDLIHQVDVIRTDHPGCGVEKLYKALLPKTMGRDKFCEVFMELGYRVKAMKNYTRTTIPAWFDYPNLIEGMQVTRPYQVLQSDITYFDINGKFYYLVFIIDVYTREILGYNVGDNLRTQCNINALKMALSKIPTQCLENMIHHSDRGSQYGSKEYVRLLKSNGIRVSMGEIAQDNAFAERINGTIKNEYLKHWHIPDFKTLKKKTKKAVNHYNKSRLHLAFNNEYSPLEFKETLLDLDNQERPKVIIYAEGNYKVKVASSHLNFKPRKEPKAHNCPMVIIDK
ncbi:MAG: IS3 family transposase [Chitinophagales bacterium]|nr:IS3 family transposase [Chitinophagales bacterium]MCO5232082.1 IS3 family transposase [Chitinophagales bacterium]